MLISHPMIKGLVTSISLGSTMWMSGKWDDQSWPSWSNYGSVK